MEQSFEYRMARKEELDDDIATIRVESVVPVISLFIWLLERTEKVDALKGENEEGTTIPNCLPF